MKRHFTSFEHISDTILNKIGRIILILLLWNCFPNKIEAQIVVDATSTVTSLASPATVSHTTGSGANRLMLVAIAFEANGGNNVTGVTYGGTPLTLVGSATNGTNAAVRIYRLINPTSGVASVSVSFTSAPSNGAIIGVTTFTGVDQISPLGSAATVTGTSTTPSVNVSSALGELVFDAVAVKTGSSLTQGAGQIELWDLSSVSERGASSTESGASTTTMSWTSSSDDWAIAGVSIKPYTSTSTLNPIKYLPISIIFIYSTSFTLNGIILYRI